MKTKNLNNLEKINDLMREREDKTYELFDLLVEGK